MDNKIQELAEKIYRDGIEKANDEAAQILKQAEDKKREILQSAQSEAETIVSTARKNAEESIRKSEEEIKLSVTNAMEALKTTISDTINGQAVEAGIEAAFKNPEVLQQIVLKMAEQLVSNSSNGVEISATEAQSLEDYFRAHAADILSQGITITQVAGKSTAFEVAPRSGGYKVQVSRESFAEYFRAFMRPRLQRILFGATDHN